jgi:hypothetical protein
VFNFRLIATLVAGAVLFAINGASASAEPVAGNTVAVRPMATVSNPEGTLVLNVGMDITEGDRIKTDKKGEVQLVFSDETKLVVGPNSSLVIEAYLLRSKSRVNNFTVRALGGSFRMITGKSTKKAYKIKTPTATIGVRGTRFDFTVRRNGETGLLLFDGEAEICSRNGNCRTLNRYCDVARTPRNEDVHVLNETENRDIQIRQNFPYALSQQSLRRDFRVRTRGCGDDTAEIDTDEKVNPKSRSLDRKKAKPEPPDKHGRHRGHGRHHGRSDHHGRGGHRGRGGHHGRGR